VAGSQDGGKGGRQESEVITSESKKKINPRVKVAEVLLEMENLRQEKHGAEGNGLGRVRSKAPHFCLRPDKVKEKCKKNHLGLPWSRPGSNPGDSLFPRGKKWPIKQPQGSL